MTEDTMDLQALLGKSADADFLREMIGFAAQRLMDLEVGALTGAGYGEKSADRLAQRNGDPRSRLGDTGRHGRAAHSQAQEGQLLSRLPRTTPLAETRRAAKPTR